MAQLSDNKDYPTYFRRSLVMSDNPCCTVFNSIVETKHGVFDENGVGGGRHCGKVAILVST